MDQLLGHLPRELWAAEVAVGGRLLVDGPLQVQLPAGDTHIVEFEFTEPGQKGGGALVRVFGSQQKGVEFKLKMAELYQNA